jgi:hypothetical protein
MRLGAPHWHSMRSAALRHLTGLETRIICSTLLSLPRRKDLSSDVGLAAAIIADGPVAKFHKDQERLRGPGDLRSRTKFTPGAGTWDEHRASLQKGNVDAESVEAVHPPYRRCARRGRVGMGWRSEHLSRSCRTAPESCARCESETGEMFHPIKSPLTATTRAFSSPTRLGSPCSLSS